MQVGDKLDAIALGHKAIDIKGILLENGYVMPQGSVAKLPKLPGEVEAEITRQKDMQEQYESLNENKVYECQFCGTKNSSDWKREISTNITFLACGECQSVVEVR